MEELSNPLSTTVVIALVVLVLFLTHLASWEKTSQDLSCKLSQSYYISKNKIDMTPEIDSIRIF